MLAFDRAELDRRLRVVQQRMVSAGVEALLVIDEPNITWVTGYQGFTAYVPQCMLVTLADPEPVLILREMDLPCARASTYATEASLFAYDERLLGLSAVPVWTRIGETLRKLLRTERVALERSASGLNYDNYRALLAALKCEPLDASGWLNEARAVKSEPELRYMREAAEIADLAMAEGIAAIREGVRESDVGATFLQRLSAGTATVPGGYPTGGVYMPVGGVANAPHLRWSDGVYQRGRQTNIELGGFRHRYCCGLARTAYLGKPPARLLQIDEVVRGAFEATLPAIRSGARCSDAYAAFWSKFSPQGVRKESRIGYGIGIEWTEGSYSLQRDDQRVLRENATLHLIIGIWEKNEGYIFSETVRVTDHGAESFSRLPRMLFVHD